MQYAWLIIWPLQGGLMLFDEFYLHKKRGLGKWESVGHPVDTLLFLSCFAYTLLVPYASESISAFIALSILSSIVIAKDEWVHHKECCLLEQWTHTFLFIVHPFALWGLFHLWKAGDIKPIFVQSIIISLFLLYQIVYWNILRRTK